MRSVSTEQVGSPISIGGKTWPPDGSAAGRVKPTDQTLLEQMRITDLEIEQRKSLFGFTHLDVKAINNARPVIEARIDSLVAQFYETQTSVPEIALLIGDADTLGRLRNAQRKYVLDLFSGLYDLEYVNNRLRIGLVHKRIGVEPKLYLAAIFALKELVTDVLRESLADKRWLSDALAAIEKLFMFDIALVFETYIRSLVAEIESSKDKSEQYARALEEKVRERTRQLEEMTRTDPLTGLQSIRHLNETLTGVLRSAQRRAESVTVVYMDIDNFKAINDTQGHQKGDDILRVVGESIRAVSRLEDRCFRYGGDEFCIILPNCGEAQALDIYVRRLKDEIDKHMMDVSMSVGCVQTGPENHASPEEMIRLADERMYAVKLSHRAQRNDAADSDATDPAGGTLPH